MERKNTILLGITIVVVLAVIVVAFSVNYTGRVVDDGKSQIGVLLPLTGNFAVYGESILKGLQGAEIPLGTVEYVYEDSTCEDVAAAVSAFRKLTDIDRVQFIIGPACGSEQEAIAPLVKDKEIIVLLPNAASRDLFEKSGGKMYQMQYSLEDESKFIAEEMNSQGYSNVALITYSNAYSQTHSDAFKENFDGSVHQFFLVDFNSDINTEIAKIRELDVDAIYVADASFFFADGMNKLREMGVDVPVYHVYPTELPAIRELTEGVIYSFPGDVSNDLGLEYNLGKESAELFAGIIGDCNGEFECVSRSFQESREFDEFGVKKRPIVLKQIRNGQPVLMD